MSAQRNVLLRRNNTLYPDRDSALAAIPGIVSENSLDGSQLLVRYENSGETKTILVVVEPDGEYDYFEDMETILSFIGDSTVMRHYNSRSDFPETGEDNVIYINDSKADEALSEVYRWDSVTGMYKAISMSASAILCNEDGTYVEPYLCTGKSIVEDYSNYLRIPSLSVFDSTFTKRLGTSVFSNMEEISATKTVIHFEFNERTLYNVTIDCSENEDGVITIEKTERYTAGTGITIEDGVVSTTKEKLYIGSGDDKYYDTSEEQRILLSDLTHYNHTVIDGNKLAFKNTGSEDYSLYYNEIQCEISDKTLKYFNKSSYTPDVTDLKATATYSKAGYTDGDVYIPFVGFMSADGIATVGVDVTVKGNTYSTFCCVTYDTPSQWTFAFVKSFPFEIIIKKDANVSEHMYSFIRLPKSFIGEIKYYFINRKGHTQIFLYNTDGDTITERLDTQATTSGNITLNEFSEIGGMFAELEPGSKDSTGQLEVDFVIDNTGELQIENGKCPDWVINDLILHQLQLRVALDELYLGITEASTEFIQEEVDDLKENKQDKLPEIPVSDTIELYPIKFDSQGHIVDYGSPKKDGTWSISELDDTDLNWVMGVEVVEGANYVYVDAPGIDEFHYVLDGVLYTTTIRDENTGYFVINIGSGEFSLTRGLDQLDLDSVRNIYKVVDTEYKSIIN